MKRHFTRRRVALLVLATGLLIWLLWPNDQLARVEAMQRDLFDSTAKLTPDERRDRFQQLRAETAKLSDADRAKLRAEGQKRMEDRMRQYFAMSPQERVHFLDNQIRREEQRRQQMAQNGGANGGGGPPGGAGAGGAGGGGPGGGGKASTPEDRERRRQQRLDATTPEFRAQMDQFRHDMAQRRQQLGLPPSTGFRPGGGR